ncbi:MAG: hypothetical protein U0Z17_07900 [Bacteroidales bacterium]
MGSGTVTYGALAWRFMKEDFRMKSVYGHVAGSTIEDWPISYEDLEPFYEKAEWELGVAGEDDKNPFAPPRKRPQPGPPFTHTHTHTHNKEASLLKNAAHRLGLHPFSNSCVYGTPYHTMDDLPVTACGPALDLPAL